MQKGLSKSERKVGPCDLMQLNEFVGKEREREIDIGNTLL